MSREQGTVGRKVSARVVAAILLAGVLSGCRVVVDTTIEPDGSGVLRSAIVYSPDELTAFVRAPGHEGQSLCDAHRQDAPTGWTFLEEEHDEETYCVVERRFADLGELAELYEGMNGVRVEKLEFGLGRLIFEVKVNRPSGEEGDAATEWRVSLPGRVESHNAHGSEGQTLAWEIGPGESETLRAVTNVGLSLRTLGPSGGLLLVGLLGALTLAVLVGAVFRRRGGVSTGLKGP